VLKPPFSKASVPKSILDFLPSRFHPENNQILPTNQSVWLKNQSSLGFVYIKYFFKTNG